MRCILWNINGLKKKQLDLNLLIEQHKPDIIFINETHLHQHDKIKIKHFGEQAMQNKSYYNIYLQNNQNVISKLHILLIFYLSR